MNMNWPNMTEDVKSKDYTNKFLQMDSIPVTMKASGASCSMRIFCQKSQAISDETSDKSPAIESSDQTKAAKHEPLVYRVEEIAQLLAISPRAAYNLCNTTKDFRVLRIIDGAAQYYMSSIGHIMGVHIETDMRRDAFDHLLRLDYTYYNNTKVGTIMGRITNDLFDVTEFAHHCPEEFFIAGIKIVSSFVILCRASIPLTLAVFACVPLMGVVSVYLNGRLRARFRQQRVQIGELNSTIEDSLLGQGVVKAFAAEDQEREKFAKGNQDFEQIKTLGYYAMGAFNTSTRLFDGLMYLVVILAGGLSLVYSKITPGDMVAYMLYVTTLIATIRRIVEFAEQFQRGITGIERFAEIIDTPVTFQDAPDAVPLQPGPGEIRRDPV